MEVKSYFGWTGYNVTANSAFQLLTQTPFKGSRKQLRLLGSEDRERAICLEFGLKVFGWIIFQGISKYNDGQLFYRYKTRFQKKTKKKKKENMTITVIAKLSL